MYRCSECGWQYDTPSKAEYCGKADLDPRKENEMLRWGFDSDRIPKPTKHTGREGAANLSI